MKTKFSFWGALSLSSQAVTVCRNLLYLLGFFLCSGWKSMAAFKTTSISLSFDSVFCFLCIVNSTNLLLNCKKFNNKSQRRRNVF